MFPHSYFGCLEPHACEDFYYSVKLLLIGGSLASGLPLLAKTFSLRVKIFTVNQLFQSSEFFIVLSFFPTGVLLGDPLCLLLYLVRALLLIETVVAGLASVVTYWNKFCLVFLLLIRL